MKPPPARFRPPTIGLFGRGAHPPKAMTALYELVHGDAFEWLKNASPASIHAVVTDPPYGLVEYTPEELEKRENGKGGVWRQPPSFDGCQRQPVPRFTVLKDEDREAIRLFFGRFSRLLFPVLVPGAHVFVATNPLLSDFVFGPFLAAGFEKRGVLIRGSSHVEGWGPPQKRSRRVPGRDRHAEVVLRALGYLQAAGRGTGSGQSASVGYRGIAKILEDRALPGLGQVLSRSTARTSHCASSFTQATGVPSPTGEVQLAARKGRWCSIRSRGLDQRSPLLPRVVYGVWGSSGIRSTIRWLCRRSPNSQH